MFACTYLWQWRIFFFSLFCHYLYNLQCMLWLNTLSQKSNTDRSNCRPIGYNVASLGLLSKMKLFRSIYESGNWTMFLKAGNLGRSFCLLMWIVCHNANRLYITAYIKLVNASKICTAFVVITCTENYICKSIWAWMTYSNTIVIGCIWKSKGNKEKIPCYSLFFLLQSFTFWSKHVWTNTYQRFIQVNFQITALWAC